MRLIGTVVCLVSAIAIIHLIGRSSVVSSLTTTVFCECAELFGPGPVRRAGPFHIVAGGHRYKTVYWCTPTVLSIIGVAAVWLRCRSMWHFWLLVPVVWVLAMAALSLNFVGSLWLRGVGLDWFWAHKPGLYAVHAAPGVLAGAAIVPWWRRLRDGVSSGRGVVAAHGAC